MTEAERFAAARLAAMGEDSDGGIGTLCERALHRVLKYYLEPDPACHEISYLGSVADIMNGEGITEIQTGGFARLKPKLERFLPASAVTVVYPLYAEKHIRWIDADSGEISPRKKSPRKHRIYDAFYELYNIREYISHSNFRLKLMLLSVEEYKYKNIKARVAGRYRTRLRVECIPDGIVDIIDFACPADYKRFIPEGLPQVFSAPEFNRAVGKGFCHGYSGIQLLISLGLCRELPRKGRMHQYELID